MTLGDGWPPFYDARSSEAIVDAGQVYLAYAVGAVLLGLFLILPGVRGQERIFFLIRWFLSLSIGASIIACIQGVSWHVASVEAKMPHNINYDEMPHFRVGIMIGLTRFNVTLRDQRSPRSTRNVSFSEEFHFLETDKALDEAFMKGLPFPIINIVEHFSLTRINSMWLWGRRYWLAGHYGAYMLWASFITWIITNVLLQTVVWYGGFLLAFTGTLALGANLSFFSVSLYGRSFAIHIGYEDSNAILRPEYGWSFWLCLSMGFFSVFLGLMVMLAHRICPATLRHFFLIEQDKDQKYGVVLESVDSSRHQSRSSSYSGNCNNAFYSTEQKETEVFSEDGGSSSTGIIHSNSLKPSLSSDTPAESISSAAAVENTSSVGCYKKQGKVLVHRPVSFDLSNIKPRKKEDGAAYRKFCKSTSMCPDGINQSTDVV